MTQTNPTTPDTDAPQPTILLLGGKRSLLLKAQKLGLTVLHMQLAKEFTPDQGELADLTVLLDYEDVDKAVEVARGLHAFRPFAAAVTITEWAQLATAHINEALGLPGVSPRTVELVTDKFAMREALNAAGVGEVGAVRGRDRSDLTDFASTYGYPFLIKPIAASGSYGVFRVSGPEDIDAVWEKLSALGLSTFLVEEFLEGREIGVEVLTFGGRHVPLGCTDKEINADFMEVAHYSPAELPSEQRADLFAFVGRVLDTLGVDEGASHTELMLTAKGPKVIETHTRRAGDRIGELTRRVYGIDMEAYTLGHPAGVLDALTESPRPRLGASVRFFEAEPGILREVRGAEEVRDKEDVVEFYVQFKAGDRVPPLRWALDRVGHVMVERPTAQEAFATATAYADSLEWVVEPDTDEVPQPGGTSVPGHEIDQAAKFYPAG
ncbi:ATP-grasp domain-containing protein [Streptomyces sp. NPDC045456]|uniref:ATP-grasp domain-containing protein n=1 Tax=Streptomyces sp. NPDC045456 TaxID=3155254 RepID=UPI0033FC2C6F